MARSAAVTAGWATGVCTVRPLLQSPQLQLGFGRDAVGFRGV